MEREEHHICGDIQNTLTLKQRCPLCGSTKLLQDGCLLSKCYLYANKQQKSQIYAKKYEFEQKVWKPLFYDIVVNFVFDEDASNESLVR